MGKDFTIFYSWQMDVADELNKAFIRDALKECLKEPNLKIEDSPRYDSGMAGAAGSPEVAKIMFEKIDQCSLFFADVTLTGTLGEAIDPEKPKRCHNPNVAIEMGYAAARLNWDRVICVMNEYFGRRDEQPFDVRNRRFPITYTLTGKEDKAEKEKIFKQLKKDIMDALETAEKSELRKVDEAFKRFDINCLKLLNKFKDVPFFSEPYPLSTEDARVWDIAIPRLLDLGVIYSEFDPNELLYAYHWTYLGDRVIKRIKVKLDTIVVAHDRNPIVDAPKSESIAQAKPDGGTR